MPKKLIVLIIATLTLLSVSSIIHAAPYTDGVLSYFVNLQGDGITICDCDTDAEGEIEIPISYTVNGQTLNVTAIQNGAFMSCDKITSVIMPYYIKSIEYNAFEGCTALQSIDFGYSLEEIGEKAFYNCDSLTSIRLPNSVQRIEKAAFINCDNLANVHLGRSLSYLDPTAFEACPKLESFTVANYNSYFSAQDGVLYNKKCTKIVKYPLGKSGSTYTLPETLTEIGPYAFYKCTRLTSITIPENVETIGECAFYANTSLKNVDIKGVKKISSSAFCSCGRLENIVLPDTLNIIEDRAFRQTYITSIDIPDGVTYIGELAFSYCNFTDIVIPDSVITIAANAFSNCKYLKKTTICCRKDNVSTFSLAAEAQTTGTSIGDSCFADCSALTDVVLGENITSIGSNVFENCTSVKNVYYEGDAASWSNISINSTNDAVFSNIVYNYQPFVYIIYETKGGICTPEAVKAQKNSSVTLSEVVPSKTANLFLGWTTAENGTSAQYQPGDTITVGESSIVLYAVWSKCVDFSAEITNDLCKIKCSNVPTGSLIFVAQYCGENMVSVRTGHYSGAETYSISLTSVVYDEVKVFIWDDEQAMYPVTYSVTIPNS